ncbi:heat shock protein 20-like protein 1 [Hibiscus trionum]|uniref:Heat shock protein 20-like protein 1 n=1 Tax=Hibiscus trionum TaxID=183268 RepID=A0A9W7IZ95_HIBTR|nr:heat shock protein 20-like protein 1 [Hibiscus trionum]
MRIHPLPRKRNVAVQFEINSRLARSETETLLPRGPHKKLRRLPHLFNRVLELPFRSDADVEVEESADHFKFVAETDGWTGGVVRAHTVEIHPGITRIVIRTSSDRLVQSSTLDDIELDMWRFRLPEVTRPELASVTYDDGKLTVTVPKGEVRGGIGGGNNNINNNNMLVLVD